MSDQIVPKRPSSPITTTLLAVTAVALLAGVVLGFMELKELRHDGKAPSASAKAFYGAQKGKDGVKFKSSKLKSIQAKVNEALADLPEADESDEDADDEMGEEEEG